MKQYDNYKNSGVEWLGEIPEHWEVKKMKFIGNIYAGINGKKGDDSTACITFEFIHKDKLGHILIEVYMELDDGGNYSSHNCCFYLNTEIGLLEKFCQKLPTLKRELLGIEVVLNDND